MSLITVTKIIENVKPEEAYAVAKQPERFAAIMPDLKSVEIINQEQDYIDTRWVGTISVGPLVRNIEWIERDWWCDDKLKCDFKLLSGDMKKYEGTWTFEPLDSNHCQIKIVLDFELGIPMIGPMINNIVNNKVKENCEALLNAVAQLCGK